MVASSAPAPVARARTDDHKPDVKQDVPLTAGMTVNQAQPPPMQTAQAQAALAQAAQAPSPRPAATGAARGAAAVIGDGAAGATARAPAADPAADAARRALEEQRKGEQTTGGMAPRQEEPMFRSVDANQLVIDGPPPAGSEPGPIAEALQQPHQDQQPQANQDILDLGRMTVADPFQPPLPAAAPAKAPLPGLDLGAQVLTLPGDAAFPSPEPIDWLNVGVQ
jgi:hypothetical protein